MFEAARLGLADESVPVAQEAFAEGKLYICSQQRRRRRQRERQKRVKGLDWQSNSSAPT